MSVSDAEPGRDEPLPDVLTMSLAELRTARHPVLREVLADLRELAARPGEMLWGFSSSF
ncbi:FxSxx-COOH cyclophane-containing RiPP peptide [Streptomyces sp. NPDC086787]|uniref:FxSxx-COOH cyclophane-containing RiPP peptide n=1 Tax=Streptomyces sp. NPDC086787 TaxID=3365759 RepID=UPI003813398E